MAAMESGQLRVGAAKVDITPPDDELPSHYRSVHDRIYARAIVLDNQHTKAVLVGVDVVMLLEGVYTELTQQVVTEIGGPVENILMAATHTHASPGIGPDGFSKVLTPFDAQQAERVKQGIYEAVCQANACLQPAQVGYGTGLFHMNVNRDAVHPDTRTWYQGPNLDGPSDKTVAVVRFESLSGELLAVFINYAMHANMMFMRNEISSWAKKSSA